MIRTTRIYFAVPGDYTTGPEFDTFAEAEAHARSTIQPFDGIPGSSRAFVDVRVYEESAASTSDRSVHRVEIFEAVTA